MRRWRSGQSHDTVNVAGIALRWFESNPAHTKDTKRGLLRVLCFCVRRRYIAVSRRRYASDLENKGWSDYVFGSALVVAGSRKSASDGERIIRDHWNFV